MIQPQALVLVAVMNDPKDLEIARLLGWYRIPLRSAPKVVYVDYLAFYQTAGFGEMRWQIHYIAPVNGHELVTRSELFKDDAEHPRAKDLYYKIQLGPLERLPVPIRAEKWKRVTFFYTTGEYLLRAQSLRDLIVYGGERQNLWHALKERANQTNDNLDGTAAHVDLDVETIEQILGLQDFFTDFN